jgi:hypothetical protein
MTTTTDLPDPNDYGYISNDWLLKQALGHVPHASLYRGVVALVSYLVNSPEVDRIEALDLLAQAALTGQYIPVLRARGVAEVPPDAEPEDPITDAEIDRFVEDIGGAFPVAEDPFENWTLK